MAPLYAGQYGPEGIESNNGRAARDTLVTVLNTDGSLATLYSNKEKTAIAENPTSTDKYGNLTFYAVPGEYGMVVNNAAFPVMVPLHPADPALGAGGGGSEHPMVDWFNGEGDPYDNPPIIGAGPGDMYRDKLNGDLYQLR